MRVIEIALCIIAVVMFATMSPSRGDGDTPTPEEPETVPLPGSESPMKDPFTPYSAGPPEALWRYDDLTPSEKNVVDRGRNVDYTSIHEGYKGAVQQRSAKASADAAARKLGLDTLETGVEP